MYALPEVVDPEREVRKKATSRSMLLYELPESVHMSTKPFSMTSVPLLVRLRYGSEEVVQCPSMYTRERRTHSPDLEKISSLERSNVLTAAMAPCSLSCCLQKVASNAIATRMSSGDARESAHE